MKLSLNVVLGVAILFATISAPAMAQDEKVVEQAAKFDAKQMLGAWTLKEGKKAGAESVAEALGETTVDEKEFRLPTPDGEFVMAYEVDATESPAHIDLSITAGPAEGAQSKGIIGMKDGNLMLCYHPMGGERPTEFTSTEDNGNHMFVMSRSKMKAEDLLGSWKYTSGQRAGSKVDETRLVGEVKIEKDTFTVPGGGEDFVMSYSLNNDTSPAQIDLEMKSGGAPAGSKALGIIKIEDGVLTFCYDNSGMNRPESFETNEENGFFMFTLEKAEESDDEGKEVEKKADKQNDDK